MLDVSKPPQVLVAKLDKPPFCHLLSTYVIRPVACDENPFQIHHKNKQPVFVNNKNPYLKGKNADAAQPRADEESSSEDDEFEKVKTDKKVRG